MRGLTLAVGLLAVWPAGAEILDRTVAIVGSEAILASEVDTQLRLEAMFNERNLDETPEAREQALQRLIDQRLIESQIALSGIRSENGAELERQTEQLNKAAFAGRSFPEALKAYGVTEEQARGFLRRQLRFAGYVSFRYRAGVEIADDKIRAEYRRLYGNDPAAPPLEQVREEITDALRQRQAEADLEDRVRQLRATTRIVRLPTLAEPKTEPVEVSP